jgi:isopenicillin N synthase-like dioxygenase
MAFSEAESTSASLDIPILNFAAFDGDGAEAFAKSLFEAFRDVGFVYLKNHGLPQETVDEAFEWVRRRLLSFFSLAYFAFHANLLAC